VGSLGFSVVVPVVTVFASGEVDLVGFRWERWHLFDGPQQHRAADEDDERDHVMRQSSRTNDQRQVVLMGTTVTARNGTHHDRLLSDTDAMRWQG